MRLSGIRLPGKRLPCTGSRIECQRIVDGRPAGEIAPQLRLRRIDAALNLAEPLLNAS